MSVTSTYQNKRRLEEAMVRRRELESRRLEETRARARYYTEFERNNTHFESWTAPEYYEQCANKLRISKIENEKKEKLEARRERLRKMLELEKTALEDERRILEQGNRNHSKRKEVSGEVLCEIYKQLKIDAEDRRRKEVEERLYQHWRKTEGCRIMEAPEFNEHQALAKMSWMDKQVEKQLNREKQAKNEIKTTKLTIDQLRDELNTLNNQQKDLKQDCDKLKISIEHELKEYKDTDEQNILLKAEEDDLISKKDKLENLYIDYNEKNNYEIDKRHIMDNFKFHKMHLKQYSELVINYLNFKIEILNRLEDINVACDKIKSMFNSARPVLIQQRKLEMKRKEQLEAMYDSEARRVYQEVISKWKKEEKDREELFLEILNTLKKQIEIKLQMNMKKQKENIFNKDKYLKSIEDNNFKLSLIETDIEFNKNRIININSELIKLQNQNEQLETYLSRSDEPEAKAILNKSLLTSESENKTPTLVSPRYQDSVKDILSNIYAPQSVFGTNIQNFDRRSKKDENDIEEITLDKPIREIAPKGSFRKANMWW